MLCILIPGIPELGEINARLRLATCGFFDC